MNVPLRQSLFVGSGIAFLMSPWCAYLGVTHLEPAYIPFAMLLYMAPYLVYFWFKETRKREFNHLLPSLWKDGSIISELTKSPAQLICVQLFPIAFVAFGCLLPLVSGNPDADTASALIMAIATFAEIVCVIAAFVSIDSLVAWQIPPLANPFFFHRDEYSRELDRIRSFYQEPLIVAGLATVFRRFHVVIAPCESGEFSIPGVPMYGGKFGVYLVSLSSSELHRRMLALNEELFESCLPYRVGFPSMDRYKTVVRPKKAVPEQVTNTGTVIMGPH